MDHEQEPLIFSQQTGHDAYPSDDKEDYLGGNAAAKVQSVCVRNVCPSSPTALAGLSISALRLICYPKDNEAL